VDRWFDLIGADNVRDLGGLPTVDGRATRYGRFLRADTLQALTVDDVDRLTGHFGLRTVLDLRAGAEAAREGRGPLEHAGLDYHNLSFLSGEWIMPDDPAFPVLVEDEDSTDRVEHYLDYLRLASDAVVAALRVLAEPASRPAVFHCAAGKDRTGVLAALVLSIAGVEADAVVADYTLTNERIALIDERLAALPSYRIPPSLRTAVDGPRCRPEVMYGFLARVEATWGGPAAWARRAGLAEAELDALRAALVE
jgi:protein tyrosine/serine phosphatase